MKVLKIAFMALTCLLMVTPAVAGGDDTSGEPFQPIDAEAMIDSCWKANADLLSNVYSIREGTFRSSLCLEDRIVEQLNALVGPENLTREEAAGDLEAIRMAYGNLVWKIYNEHKKCTFRTCGLYDQSIHVSALAEFMEGLLREVVRQRNRFEL